MTKFGNSPIDNCKFNNIKVNCYEPQTCKSIEYNNQVLSDAKAVTQFKQCSNGGSIVKDNDEAKDKSLFVVIGLFILGGTVAVLTAVFVVIKIVKKRKSLEIVRSHLMTIRETEVMIS